MPIIGTFVCPKMAYMQECKGEADSEMLSPN